MTTQGTQPANLKTTGEDEEDIQTEAWDNTYEDWVQKAEPVWVDDFEEFEEEETETFTVPYHAYRESTAIDRGPQVIHFMGKNIAETRQIMEQWGHTDPLSWGQECWMETDYKPFFNFYSTPTTDTVTREEYLLDSEATCHVTNCREYLENEIPDKTRIIVGENSSCPTLTSGTLNLTLDTHDEGIDRLPLERVFLVPMFNKKVISIPLLIERGYSFVFKGRYCMIIAPDRKYLQVGAGKDHLFYINILRKHRRELTPADYKIDPKQTKAQINTYDHKTVNINNIHDKFGHVGETLLKKTMRHLGFEVRGTLKSCDA